MCFSADADLVAGSVVGVLGIGALRQVRRPEELALGVVPVVLAAHLLVEVPIWWGLSGGVAPDVLARAVSIYLVIALVVLPVLVPGSLRAVEPAGRRRSAMTAATALGASVAAVYLVAVVRGPITAEIQGHHLVYSENVPHGGLLAAAYVVVTCGPLLASSHRRIVAFGLANIVAVAVLDWVARNGLTSLWCAWAAVTSLAISAHLRMAHGPAASTTHPLRARPPSPGDNALA